MARKVSAQVAARNAARDAYKQAAAALAGPMADAIAQADELEAVAADIRSEARATAADLFAWLDAEVNGGEWDAAQAAADDATAADLHAQADALEERARGLRARVATTQAHLDALNREWERCETVILRDRRDRWNRFVRNTDDEARTDRILARACF